MATGLPASSPKPQIKGFVQPKREREKESTEQAWTNPETKRERVRRPGVDYTSEKERERERESTDQAWTTPEKKSRAQLK